MPDKKFSEEEWLKKHKRFVYCIQSDAKGKPVKIGWSKNPEKRLKQLYSSAERWPKEGNLTLLFKIPVAYPQHKMLEDACHRSVAAARAGPGVEWFMGADLHRLLCVNREQFIADWSELDAYLDQLDGAAA